MFQRLPDGLAAFVEKRPVLCLLIVVAYVLSPIDILPEIVVGPLGAFDDALVGIAALSLLKRAAKRRFPIGAEKKPDVIDVEEVSDRRPPPPARDDRRPERPPERRPEARRNDERGGDRRPHEGRRHDRGPRDRRPDHRRPDDRRR